MSLTLKEYLMLQLCVLFAALAVTYSANSLLDELSPDPVGPPPSPVVYTNHVHGSPPPYYRPFYDRPKIHYRYDIISVCGNVRCNRWSECRIVQQCPTCLPQPMCVNYQNIPQDAERVCQSSTFRQVVLLGQSANNVRPLRCLPFFNIPRGGCAAGSQCVTNPFIISLVAEGFCCAGSSRTPFLHRPHLGSGTSPHQSYTPAQLLPLSPQPSPVAPVQTQPNLGVCPIPNSVFSQCSGSPCEFDDQCLVTQKCCLGPCGGKTCTEPLPQLTRG